MSYRSLPVVLPLAAFLLLLLPGAPTPAFADTKAAVKEFKQAQKAEDWKARREAYLVAADYDSEDVAKALLDALTKEENPAVQLMGLRVLAGFESEGARGRLVQEAKKARGTRKQYVLMALARQRSDAAREILLATVQSKDGPSAAQAALALGRSGVEEAVPHLLKLLVHKDWQVRRAAGMALASLAQPPPPKAEPGKPVPKDFRWPVSDALKAPAVSEALIKALETGEGVERGAMIDALAAIHGQDQGNNPAAWRAVVAGTEVDKRLERKRVWPPAAFGIPLYGQRIVFIYDNSLRSGDPHRFGTGARREEVCQVPGGPPLLSSRLLTVGQFARAHITRAVSKLDKGQRFEVITFNATVQGLAGKFTSSGGASKKALEDLFAGLEPDDGINSYGALTEALDLGGATDAKAWKRGPDEIVFITCNQPTQGELSDADVVAAAIGLKGRMRMVRIHTIGIESHPYSMLETIAKETGGVYRNYYE